MAHPRLAPRASQATPKGITTAESVERLKIYGPNKLPEETRNPFLVGEPWAGFLGRPMPADDEMAR